VLAAGGAPCDGGVIAPGFAKPEMNAVRSPFLTAQFLDRLRG
jgi:hypothetical protein